MAVNKKRGFTLLELLIVVAVIALGTAGVALAMRDSGQAVIEREAIRLAALLDAARSQSRASGVTVTWESTIDAQSRPVMRWSGLRGKEPLPTAWLDEQTQAAVSRVVLLGPDPIISPVQIRLTHGSHTREVVTDGVDVFRVGSP